MTTPSPLNFNTQIPEKSILDINGKQTYLGNSFTIISSLSLADFTEHPEVLIVNPSTSGKALFVFNKMISAVAQVYARYYVDPTITTNGTPVVPLNLRPAFSTITVSTPFTAPTISANGKLGTLITTANGSINSGLLMVIDPGHSLLITAQSLTGTVGTPVATFIQTSWYEI